MRTKEDGTKVWRNKKGHEHRLDGPAIIGPDGYEAWYRDGRLHREGGPAVTWPSGQTAWYYNGWGHPPNDPSGVLAIYKTRDNQQRACYRWDRKLGYEYPAQNPMLTLDECKHLVESIWFDYYGNKYPVPNVLDSKRRRGEAYGSRRNISLPEWAKTVITVIHETAHAVMGQYKFLNNEVLAAHGPEFARLELELLGEYAGIPAKEAREIANELKPRKVKFSLARDIPQPIMAASDKRN